MASTSQLHSRENGNWDWDLGQEMGIPDSLFPIIGTAGDRIGELKPEFADKLGGNRCPVRLPACHDTASAFAAAPCVDDETAILSSGTWSMLGMRTTHPILTREVFDLGGGNYSLPGNDWALSRGIMGLLLLDRFKNEEGFASLRELVELAKLTEPLTCLIDPENPLFQAREPIANLIRGWADSTDQRIPNSPGEMTRTILESLALFNGEAASSLARITGRTLKRLVIVGGGARNELLNQMTSDASGVEVAMGPSESTAIGNILVQAVGAGDLENFSQISGVVQTSFPIKTFVPGDSDRWAQAREKYDSLKPIRIEPAPMNRRR
jgi:rhamnulokinase